MTNKIKLTDELVLPVDERGGLPSASGLSRVALCPKSYKLEATQPQPPDSPWAARGTRVHGVMDGSVNREDLSAEELDVVRELEEYDKLLFHDVTNLTREVRLWYEHEGERLWSGKLDIAARCKVTGSGIVCNYKTGRGQDMVRTNWQAKAEAVLWWMQWRDQGMTDVRYCFAQPESMFDHVLCHTFNEKELIRAERDIKEAVLLALSGDGWLEPSEDACRWCKATAICPALQYKINAYKDVPTESFVDMTATERGHHLSKAREAKDAATKVYESLASQTKEFMSDDSESVRGWYMAKGREVNSITSTKVALKLATDLGISADEFYSRASISTSSLEKMAASQLKVKDPKQWVRDNFQPVIRSSNARASLKARRTK